jgi:CRISPR type III-A-associated RAMP protein Csm4
VINLREFHNYDLSILIIIWRRSLKIIYIKPKSSFKTCIDSDNLWGSIIWGIRMVYSGKEVEDIIGGYLLGKPPFIISSPFLYEIKNNEVIHYLPRPGFKKNYQKIDGKILKKYKKIKYIPDKVFNDLLTGKKNEEEYILSQDWKEISIVSENIQHNTINRMSGGTFEGKLFYTSEYFFRKRDGGLYFLFEGKYFELIQSALRWLSVNGVGGDTSTGKGCFEVAFNECSFLPEVKDATDFMTLSLYYPSVDELSFYSSDKENLSYEIIARKGKMSKFNIRKDVWKNLTPYFREGSIFPEQKKTDYGRIIITKPKEITGLDYDIYSNGYAFPIKLNMQR